MWYDTKLLILVLTYPLPEKRPDVIIGSEKYYRGNGLKIFLWTDVFQNNLIFSISWTPSGQYVPKRDIHKIGEISKNFLENSKKKFFDKNGFTLAYVWGHLVP